MTQITILREYKVVLHMIILFHTQNHANLGYFDSYN